MTLEPAFMSSRSGFRRKPAGLVTEHLGREMHRRSTTDAAFSRPKRGTPWRTKVPGRDRSDRIRRAQTIVAVQADCSIARARALMQNVADTTDETLEHVADEVIRGSVRFDRDS